jgi:hypothetical protein
MDYEEADVILKNVVFTTAFVIKAAEIPQPNHMRV